MKEEGRKERRQMELKNGERKERQNGGTRHSGLSEVGKSVVCENKAKI